MSTNIVTRLVCENCGYFGMKMRDMIFNVMTISPIIGKPKYKVLFRPFYIKQKEN